MVSSPGGASADPTGQAGAGLAWLLAAGLAVLGSGCASSTPTMLTEDDRQPYTQAGIQPGDLVKSTFPSAPTMNFERQVQSDGNIALPLGGTLNVKGKSALEVQEELLALYGSQLVVKSISVSVESAGFPVFVSGAVLRPGRVQCNQSVTVLEAIIEAGGFHEGRADLSRVKVVRLRPDGTSQTYLLNLKDTLKGSPGTSFYLRPSDVVYVPERFSFY